jgi:Ca2+-binding RTX toxin-like protein
MAVFQAFNAAGVGFNMTSTSSSGWTFMRTNPYVTTDLVYDDGSLAIFDVYGSSQIDRFGATYWSNGYDILIDDLLYEKGGYAVLSIKDLNLYTTTQSLESNAWYVTLNTGHDIFYGNDYADVIRAGYGNDVVYSYGGHDIVYGDSGNDRLYGLAGDDDLYGGIGQDVLSGGSGSDFLSGGANSDTLTGGSGQDYFVFNTRTGSTNIDRIVDFTPSDDTIMLDNGIFTRLGPDGWLSSAAFTIGSGARDASDRVVYNKSTGALLYDPDGYGGVAAIKIAQMQAGLAITKYDFYVL